MDDWKSKVLDCQWLVNVNGEIGKCNAPTMPGEYWCLSHLAMGQK